MSNTEKLSKAAYSQPKLMVYGNFSQLTAGGSGTLMEGAAMTRLMRFP
jgi:hypothetical protein